MSDINEAVTKHVESKSEIFAHCNVSEKDRTPDPLEDHCDRLWLEREYSGEVTYFKDGEEYGYQHANIYANMRAVREVHGHQGATEVVFIDEEEGK